MDAAAGFAVRRLTAADVPVIKAISTRFGEAFGEPAAYRGAWVIFVQADCDDAPAIALYKRLGRRADPALRHRGAAAGTRGGG
jgi:hypothetical protein